MRGIESSDFCHCPYPPALPTIKKPYLSISVDLLTLRITDLQAMGWESVRQVRVSEDLRGEVTVEVTIRLAVPA